jgi:putative nucleotidyltransferase with HDIG domain
LTGAGERLRASPAIRTAAEAVDGPAWVVGGAVRDAALDRQVVDADVVVEPGTEASVAKAIARAAGGAAFPLSEEFGTWRALDAAREWHVDVTPLRGGGLDADLALRDFTINALAVQLDDLDAAPVDRAGGVGDIERGVLRAVSGRAFADDPLRLLRAARLAASLDLEIEAGTVELARAEAGRAAEPAGERRLAELRQLVAGDDPIRAFELLHELGATGAVLPELEALRGVEQNPNHHLDVHGHTIEVLRQLLVIEADLDAYAGESASGVRALLGMPLGDGFTRGDGLRLGALMHDIGKPATKGEHSGYVTFIGHDSVGAGLVAESLGRLNASRALSRYVEGLTRHHLHLGFMVYDRPLPRRRLFEYLALCGDVAPDVTILTAADRMSARGSGAVATPEMIAAHLELVREVLPAALEWQRGGPPDPPVRGDELARELGIEEGPRLGELLDELRAAVFAGEVSDREGAIDHARRALAATSD